MPYPIGHVSDEDYGAIADVLVDFEQNGQIAATARSSAFGAVLADILPGVYGVTLAKPGFGSKRAVVEIDLDRPCSFRLLSDRLTGFVWPKWVRSGERGEFRVHAVEPYHLSLYYFHARTESGVFFSFPWVVAPLRPQSRIAVLASTNTWNAYNSFGGRSNYVNASGLPAKPTVNARQDLQRYQGGAYEEWLAPDEAYAPLSFERPERGCHVPEQVRATDPIAGRDACHLAPAEWRSLAWMEREGLAYDLYSEQQLDCGAVDLDAYKVLVLNVHPEYWSRAMYVRVKEWVTLRGGRLIYPHSEQRFQHLAAHQRMRPAGLVHNLGVGADSEQ